jgi:hypothetical protein
MKCLAGGWELPLKNSPHPFDSAQGTFIPSGAGGNRCEDCSVLEAPGLGRAVEQSGGNEVTGRPFLLSREAIAAFPY